MPVTRILIVAVLVAITFTAQTWAQTHANTPQTSGLSVNVFTRTLDGGNVKSRVVFLNPSTDTIFTGISPFTISSVPPGKYVIVVDVSVGTLSLLRWADGSFGNVRTVTITRDTTLIAIYQHTRPDALHSPQGLLALAATLVTAALLITLIKHREKKTKVSSPI